MGWSKLRYLKLTVAYDGTNYHGFQRQTNAVGVQQVLEKALTKLMGEDIKLAASGRTDTGVHAYGQVVSFQTKGSIPTEKIVAAMKSFLPSDIVVWRAEDVDRDFNARYSAISKRYKYRILLRSVANPFERNYAWQLPKQLNLAAMQEASSIILGTHDFSAFRSLGSAPVTPVKTMTKVLWQKYNEEEIVFVIEGDGFLYHMVRNIVGTLVRVGTGKITVKQFEEILLSGDRKLAGMAAPPQGLYLEEVHY